MFHLQNTQPKPVGKQKYPLETFNTDITSTAIPLGYSFQRQNSDSSNTFPQASKLCDYKDCSARTSEKTIHLQYPVFIPSTHLACKWLMITVLSVENLSSLN